MKERIRRQQSTPAYLMLLENGMLAERVSAAWRHMQDCDLCTRYCHVNRLAGARAVGNTPWSR